jgi:hypothetical protein
MLTIRLLAVFSVILCFGCNYAGSPSNFPPTVTVKVSPPAVTLAVSGQQQFTAMVTGTSMTAVTWGVGGLLCPGQDCGTITQSGLYTAPGVVPLQNQVTVQATSQANALDFGQAQVVIMGAAVAALRGTYAFILLGSDADGPVSLTGTFDADGADHIHSGEMSLCRGASSCTRLAFEGRYKTNQNEQGEIVVDVLPDAVLHFAPAENGRLTLTLFGKNDLHAVGTMTTPTSTIPPERNHSY